MGLVVKTLLAFCIGTAAMAGLRTYWMSSIKQELRSNHAALPQVEMKPIPKFDATKFRAAINPKIDNTFAEWGITLPPPEATPPADPLTPVGTLQRTCGTLSRWAVARLMIEWGYLRAALRAVRRRDKRRHSLKAR